MRRLSTATPPASLAVTRKYRPVLSSFIVIAIFFPFVSKGQAITSIITDYNGWYVTSAAAQNPVKPSNSHNLLAFTYNGVQYSTGANDALLNSRGQTFSSQDFWSLPVDNITGTVNANTKVGVGQLYDGVSGGASATPPINDIALYLTDGTKGLDIGTCIANLPAGSMTFFVNNINPASIGDGVPDILVTQIADPSGSYDRYEFVNATDARVGNYKDIIFTNINPVGNWTADFYEASRRPMILTAGFTNTDRPIRLWAADLSEFGITVANYQSIKKFKINLSGNSDVAFAAYNNRSIQINNPLPVKLTDFSGKLLSGKVTLGWTTQTEIDNESFTIERSRDYFSFSPIGIVDGAGNSAITRVYSYDDVNAPEGNSYYRLKMKSTSGEITYSQVIMIRNSTATQIMLYPNPASGHVTIRHQPVMSKVDIRIINSLGITVLQKPITRSSAQTIIQTTSLTNGIYFLVWDDGINAVSHSLVIRK